MFLNLNRILSFLLLLSISVASTGKIIGVVTDKETGEPLIGANVFLVEMALDTPTDMGNASQAGKESKGSEYQGWWDEWGAWHEATSWDMGGSADS